MLEVFPSVREVMKEDRIKLGREIIKIDSCYGMTVRPCAEGDELAQYGADCSGCMTVKLYEEALYAHLVVPKRKTNQRNGQCDCLPGVDIGAYDTCGHLCKYCNANSNVSLVKANMKKHDPNSPFLLGNSTMEDKVHEAKQESWIAGQMSFLL